MRNPELRLFDDEIIVDNFAGAGGASVGIEMALGRSPDIAINHDAEAVAMHAANHPTTKHYCEDVWTVDPVKVCAGRPVGLAWFSPDCKHFSKAKGGKPVEKKIRGLAWIVVKWAKAVKPRIIILENVEEFADWGPLVERDGKMFPDPLKKGLTFRRWIGNLRGLGYEVDWQEIAACDYGAPTTRTRLFLVARCDGKPIVWPKPTHAEGGHGGLKPWRTAAECIDFSIPTHSIFLTPAEAKKVGVRRPLANNTMRRIARGIKKFVIDSAKPFIVPLTHQGSDRVEALDEPMRTVTGYGLKGNETRNGDLFDPLPTVTADPRHAVVASNLMKFKGTSQHGQSNDEPLHTIQAGGNHYAEVRAFLIKYHTTGGQMNNLHDPMPTIPATDSIGIVMVNGQEYVIVDIGMRMLVPRELFNAQGLPRDYIIDIKVNGKPLPKDAQVRMVGNSVSPYPAEALVVAQFAEQTAEAVA